MRDPQDSIWQDGLLMSRYWKTSRWEERPGKKSKMKDCGMKEKVGNFSVHQPV